MKQIKPTVKPVPYYTVDGTPDERQLAAALRGEFVPKMARRLPGHHLCGFRHDFIISFVKKHKKRYPYFLRTDIAGFYPNIRHRDIVVGAQIAYRDLLGLDYVPSAFKKRYVGGLQAWTNSLPLHRGIPLGSSLSAIAAPLMLIPLWLEIKRLYNVPFIIYMDDILVLTDSPGMSAEIYAYIENRLFTDFDLLPNTAKTQSGRFSDTALDFCGWHFAGGYARVSDDKLERFRNGINQVFRSRRRDSIGPFIKKLNHKIDGFGNFYKHGEVKNQFSTLDVIIRSHLRDWLRERTGRYYGNGAIERLGLHSLTGIKESLERRQPARQKKVVMCNRTLIPLARQNDIKTLQERKANCPPHCVELLDSMDGKLTQMVAIGRKQLRVLQNTLQ